MFFSETEDSDFTAEFLGVPPSKLRIMGMTLNVSVHEGRGWGEPCPKSKTRKALSFV